MWKKDDSQGRPTTGQSYTTATEPAETAKTATAAPPAPARPVVETGQRAIIGRSITIRGDVTGDEDLLIQGHIEGKVDLKLHRITIGPEGKVKANVVGRTVTVEGEVEGDLRGQEQVVLRATARVHGNISSPRVSLEEGAVFRGSVDMSEQPTSGARPQKNGMAVATSATSPAAPAPAVETKETVKAS